MTARSSRASSAASAPTVAAAVRTRSPRIEPHDAVLGRRVVPDVRDGHQPGGRAGQDDRSASGLAQVRDRRLGGVPDAGQVDVDHVLPVGIAELFKRAEAEDPGVGRHDVEPPEPGHAVVQRGLQRAVVPHVGLGGHDAAVEGLDLLDRLGQVRRARHRVRDGRDLARDVDRDDVGAFFGQPDRVAAALAARRAGDEGDLALYSPWHIHCSFTVRYFVVLVVTSLLVKPASTGSVTPVT